VAGWTWPNATVNSGGTDAFVAQINAAGTALVYCGYIGGSRNDVARGVVAGVHHGGITRPRPTSPWSELAKLGHVHGRRQRRLRTRSTPRHG
jgi:hypothetical protein